MLETTILVSVGLVAGVLLGVNRATLGRLGMYTGAARASVINHVGGFIFILVLFMLTNKTLSVGSLGDIPLYAFLGGIVGALFVALVSWLVPRVGVMKTSILLVSGEVIMSTIIDLILRKVSSLPLALIGLSLIICGNFVGNLRKRI